MQFLLILVLLLAAVAVISAPLRSERREDSATDGAELERLEAAREAKYREIRDAELDYRTGKLSEEDFRRVDGQLRAEAVQILRELDAARSLTSGER